MSYGLNSQRWSYTGLYRGLVNTGVAKGDSRSLDNGLYWDDDGNLMETTIQGVEFRVQVCGLKG